MRPMTFTMIAGALLTATPIAQAQSAVPAPPPAYAPAPPQFAPAPPPAPAPAPMAAPSGFHQHDGFFLRLMGGIGSLGSEASQAGINAKVSGTGGLFSLALGGAVAENFIIGGELWAMSVSSPKIEMNGISATGSGGNFGLSGIGLNLTYYFMPVGIYLQATPSIASTTLELNGSSASTKDGFALLLAAGKEWWVSDNWGIGFAVQYAHSSNKDTGTNPPTWKTNWFGAALSATYN